MRPLKKRVKKSFQVVRNDSVILGETRRVIKWIQLKNKELMVIVNENKKWSCPEKQDEAIMDRIKYIFEWDWDSKSQNEICCT